MGPSLLGNYYVENKFHNKIRVTPLTHNCEYWRVEPLLKNRLNEAEFPANDIFFFKEHIFLIPDKLN